MHNRWEDVKDVTRFILKNTWPALLVGAVFGITIWILLRRFDVLGNAEAAIGLVTLISVWLIEKRRQWRDSLPKRLSVHYWYWDGGNETQEPATAGWATWAIWEDAYLAGETDIRQTAQSLGQILNDGVFLNLEGYLYLESENPPVSRDPQAGETESTFRRYVAHLALATKPAGHRRERTTADSDATRGSASERVAAPRAKLVRRLFASSEEGGSPRLFRNEEKVKEFLEAVARGQG